MVATSVGICSRLSFCVAKQPTFMENIMKRIFFEKKRKQVGRMGGEVWMFPDFSGKCVHHPCIIQRRTKKDFLLK